MKMNDNELEKVTGGAGAAGANKGAELGAKNITAKQSIPMVCNDGCHSARTFYLSGKSNVVKCPYCGHLYVING